MNLKQAYDEACKCGYVGTFFDWVKSVGLKSEDLDRKEGEKKDAGNRA